MSSTGVDALTATGDQRIVPATAAVRRVSVRFGLNN
jgi:hypothetical protein